MNRMEKKRKNERKNIFFFESHKNYNLEESSAGTALILLLRKIHFPVWIRVESGLFRDFEEMYSNELELKQRLSPLIIFEPDLISADVLCNFNLDNYDIGLSPQKESRINSADFEIFG